MTARAVRPRRRDVFVHPVATPLDLTIGNALAPFDRAVAESERAWGIDRLQELVSPESAAKWGSAVGKLNAAIEAEDAAEIAARVGVCIRGLVALDAEARQRGHRPVPPDVLIYEQDGQRIGVVQDARDWTTLRAAHPDLRLYSMREVFNAVQHYGQTVGAVKDAFPNAEVVAVRQRASTDDLNDSIPF